MKRLDFKQKTNFESGQVYSVCLRGARRFERDVHDLSLYDISNPAFPVAFANIISENQYSFYNLIDEDYSDNCDLSARTFGGLYNAMKNVYEGFRDREIVTILRFRIE